jgi:hypothetical protein
VVWRLPPELTHQFDAVAAWACATVTLADAAFALLIALAGLGQILGPRAGLPVLAPRELAPRLAVAALVANGGLAIGGWAINCTMRCWSPSHRRPCRAGTRATGTAAWPRAWSA